MTRRATGGAARAPRAFFWSAGCLVMKCKDHILQNACKPSILDFLITTHSLEFDITMDDHSKSDHTPLNFSTPLFHKTDESSEVTEALRFQLDLSLSLCENVEAAASFLKNASHLPRISIPACLVPLP